MGQKKIGISLDLLSHPGETLKEALEDRDMTQEELASRAGVTQKHISKIINGNSPVSVSFAKKLEYVLGIDANFWINLQNNYNLDIERIKDINNITDSEINIIKNKSHKKIIEYLSANNWIDTSTETKTVISLRKFLEVAKLTNLNQLSVAGVYRKSSKFNEDPFVMFTWQKICKTKLNEVKLSASYSEDKLINSLTNLKKLMNQGNDLTISLKEIFCNCGIAFAIVKNFSGAPVNAVTKYNTEGYFEICITLRNAFADIFWFSLFHEIGHILNGDAVKISTDIIEYSQIEEDKEKEQKADEFAENLLINKEEYQKFILENDFGINAINKFALSQSIPNFIVIGRLQKQNKIPWNHYNYERKRYKWA